MDKTSVKSNDVWIKSPQLPERIHFSLVILLGVIRMVSF